MFLKFRKSLGLIHFTNLYVFNTQVDEALVWKMTKVWINPPLNICTFDSLLPYAIFGVWKLFWESDWGFMQMKKKTTTKNETKIYPETINQKAIRGTDNNSYFAHSVKCGNYHEYIFLKCYISMKYVLSTFKYVSIVLKVS